jgi:RNA recognition motif-containing protein
VSTEELKDTFSTVGSVRYAKVVSDRDTGKSKGFGFVEMSSPKEAQDAISKLNQTKLGERTIFVVEAKEDTRKPRY